MPIDYSKYPKDWKEIRARVLKRAKNKCEWKGCKCKNGEIVSSVKINGSPTEWYRDGEFMGLSGLIGKIKQIKVILTVAHLDHDEQNENIKDDRLMAMCQLHHLKYDAKEKARRKKQGESNVR